MRFEALGHRVLVKPKELEEKTEAGIILNYGDKAELYKKAAQQGTVVAVGPNAWKNSEGAYYANGGPWCNVGDEVLFGKYAGKDLIDPDTKEHIFVLNDEDILARIRSKENE